MQEGVVKVRAGAARRWLCGIAALAAALPLCVASVWAADGYISTPNLNAIYGQPTFGSNPIQIHWLSPGASVVNAALTSIDTDAELISLFRLAPASAGPGIGTFTTVFFVDQINFCGSPGGGIVGCGQQPGDVLMVNSFYAAGSTGAELIAHELGHNLDLGHNSTDAGNLMAPTLSSSFGITADQVSTILSSSLPTGGSLVHKELGTGNYYINLLPIAVIASAVPESETYAMLLAGLALVGMAARRRRRIVA